MGASPDYIVLNAGTAAANGDYYENGTHNSKPAYEKDGGGGWLYYSVWGGLPTTKAWAINETMTDNGTGDIWYYDQADGALPAETTYSVGGAGSLPAADVAAG